MVHAPRSFFTQKGPPGWTRKTSRSPCLLRNIRIPALRFGTRKALRLMVSAEINIRRKSGSVIASVAAERREGGMDSALRVLRVNLPEQGVQPRSGRSELPWQP